MIEIREDEKRQGMQGRRGLLYVDGKFYENAHIYIPPDSATAGGYCSITSQDEAASKAITKHSFSDIPLTPEYIDLQKYPTAIKHEDTRGIFISESRDEDKKDVLLVTYYLGGDILTVWKAPYTFADYSYELYSKLKKHKAIWGVELYDKEGTTVRYRDVFVPEEGIKRVEIDIDTIERYTIHSLAVTFRISYNKTLTEEIERTSAIVREAHDEVEGHLLTNTSKLSVTAAFDDFPKEVRTYCEQYLMYFIQFLQDLGVDATSELRHEAGKVLFTVTPNGEFEALDKIRAALDVYLHLPSNPVGNDLTTEIAVQRLEYQVGNLQNNLRLAAAELQAKDKTIQAQEVIINVQKALLSGEIQTSLETPKDDRVEFLDGSVALSVYKDKGIEFNWAKMFNHLRRLFRSEEHTDKP